MKVEWFVSVIILAVSLGMEEGDFCTKDDGLCSSKRDSLLKERRYLLYDVNPGEGFNLRRDVYMRIAALAKKIREVRLQEDWILVLPPWGPLYHWKSEIAEPQIKIPWSEFFDLRSLSKYVPVIEFETFLKENGDEIEEIFYLQHYEEGWTEGKWEEKMDIRKCLESHPYSKSNGIYSGWFWGYQDVYAIKFNCLSVQGFSSTLLPLFTGMSKAKSIMIDRAEVILHDNYGDKNYWDIRRSMRFASTLIEIGNKFRREYLNSSDDTDKTILDDDWQKVKARNSRSAMGGPYIAVHLRRQDFVRSRPTEIPSIKYASEQITKILKKYSLLKVFVATDAPNYG
ncbi:GDP-fucose protein O-fucosyltransferase 2-like isoform X1 [Centruroides sculpturatus]|uniref:GDP-fucose protein O-fucosyltransferase 2-like isoform X1 n=1 Tax=Centruroides sculpturatus TaxID=218467 RepID=UPI000C6CC000|nr:GDP-fucose protein O-fucosyltransferase 2-like isoform X1 [Centruroides sculpturatus]